MSTMLLSVTGSKPCEELPERPRRRLQDAPAQDLAVPVWVGNSPERVERCVEVRGKLTRDQERSELLPVGRYP